MLTVSAIDSMATVFATRDKQRQKHKQENNTNSREPLHFPQQRESKNRYTHFTFVVEDLLASAVAVLQ